MPTGTDLSEQLDDLSASLKNLHPTMEELLAILQFADGTTSKRIDAFKEQFESILVALQGVTDRQQQVQALLKKRDETAKAMQEQMAALNTRLEQDAEARDRLEKKLDEVRNLLEGSA